MLDVRRLEIPDIVEIIPAKFGDERGFFSEVYNGKRLRAAGLSFEFVQDNHSLSNQVHTLRGLHFQVPPRAQGKLVRVLKGAVLDVAVDIRAGSPTFGKWVSIELSADKWNQVLIPIGFAHGLLTLTPDTEVFYKVTDFYSKDHDRGIRWDDPDLGIDWRLGGAVPLLSEKDRRLPRLREISSPFSFVLQDKDGTSP